MIYFSFILIVTIMTSCIQSIPPEDNINHKTEIFREFVDKYSPYDNEVKKKPSFESYLNRGKFLFDYMTYNPAIDDFTEALKLKPNDVEAYRFRSLSYQKIYKYEESVKDIDNAIESAPSNGHFYSIKGISLESMGKFDSAIASYGKAISLEPRNPMYKYQRANIYLQMDAFEKANTDLDAAIDNDPLFDEAHVLKGKIHFYKHEYDMAEKEYYHALEINQDSISAMMELRQLFEVQKKFIDSYKIFMKSMRLNFDKTIDYVLARTDSGSKAYAHILTGILVQCKNDMVSAEKYYRKATQTVPSSFVTWFVLADFLYRSGKKQEAAIYWTRAIGLCPDLQSNKDLRGWTELIKLYKEYENTSTFRERGNWDTNFQNIYIRNALNYFSKEEYDNAISELEKAEKLKPYDSGSLNDIACSLLSIHKYDKGIDYIKKALAIDKKNPLIYANLADAYYESKQFDQAVIFYSKAMELDPLSTSIVKKAISHEKLSLYNKAITDYSDAISINPFEASSYGHRATILAQQNNFFYAINDFSAAISLDPKNTNYYVGRGNVYSMLNKKLEACSDFTIACKLGSCDQYYRAKNQGWCW